MRSHDMKLRAFGWLVCLGLVLTAAPRAASQVSPAEIQDPNLKGLEEKYLQQLKELNRRIRGTSFPLPFVLSRYVGLDPAMQVGTDSRGLEFVSFHGRVLLKITGNYNAAYNAAKFTGNERAARTFQDVFVPILQLVSQVIPPDITCNGIGFEISYHVRTSRRNSEYEGKEILVVVFDNSDAFAFPAAGIDEHQQILNRSEIYLNGKEFGLMLGAREPRDLEDRFPSPPSHPAEATVSGTAGSNPAGRQAKTNPFPPPGPSLQGASRINPVPGSGPSGSQSSTTPPPAATAADAERLQAQFQAKLDELAKEGAARFHFVDYAPPSFAIFHNQIVLQITVRNPRHFDASTTSIYKRAAQSFDLFLAPFLKELLEKTPADAGFDAFDITVLNEIGTEAHSASEAVEFVCPRNLLRQFVEAEITNQQLIDQSAVLVNGVRITLNLQLVE